MKYRNKATNSTFTIMLICVIYSTILILSNITSNKLTYINSFVFDAGFLFFPFTYVINDIATEVYGFKTSRNIIWLGLLMSILSSLMLQLVILMPDFNENAKYFDNALSTSYRIFLGSILSYFVGEFLNSVIMSKSKILLAGKLFALRSVFSTSVAVVVESAIFFIIAFYNIVDNATLFNMFWSQVCLKIVISIFCSPLSYKISNLIKNIDKIDAYDFETKYTPF